MDVRAALVGISGRQRHGLRLDQSQYSRREHCLCRRLWLQYQSDRDHCPGRRELQIRLGQGTLRSSLPQPEPTRPRAKLGVFLLKRDGNFGRPLRGGLPVFMRTATWRDVRYWHKADMAPRLAASVFGGKADILFNISNGSGKLVRRIAR